MSLNAKRDYFSLLTNWFWSLHRWHHRLLLISQIQQFSQRWIFESFWTSSTVSGITPVIITPGFSWEHWELVAERVGPLVAPLLQLGWQRWRRNCNGDEWAGGVASPWSRGEETPGTTAGGGDQTMFAFRRPPHVRPVALDDHGQPPGERVLTFSLSPGHSAGRGFPA